MTDPKVTIPVEVEINPSSLNARGVQDFVTRMSREMGRVADRNPSAVSQAMFGSSKQGNSGTQRKLIDPKQLSFMEGQFKKSSGVMGRAFEGVGKIANKLFEGFRKSNTELDKMAANLEAIAKQQKALEQSKAGGGTNGGLFGVGMGNTPRTSAGQLKRGLGRTAGFIGGSVLSMLGGAYNESIQAYEQYAQASLGAAPQRMNFYGTDSGVSSSKKAASLGFSPTDEVNIQKRAASLGLGRGAEAGETAMEITRALGEQGVEIAAALRKRMGAGDTKAQLAQVKRDLSAVVASGIASGLQQERIPEILNASNSYAEKQLAITPTQDTFIGFAKQVALLSSSGVAGLQGAKGANALQQADQAIKGASGAQQALSLRAFGFGGGGTSYFEALKRQEQGVGDARNLPAIMQQLVKEYGANKEGGLGEQGLMAFKRMGLGSMGMGEQFSKIFLEQKAGNLTSQQAQAKIDKVVAEEQESKMPQLQKNAYRAMAFFGKEAKLQAERMAQFVEIGKDVRPIKDAIIALQIEFVKTVAPVLVELGKALPPLIKAMAPLFQILAPMIKEIAKGIGYISVSLQGFFGGMASHKGNIFGALGAGAKGAMLAQDEYAKKLQSYEKANQPQDYDSLKQDLRTKMMMGKSVSDEEKESLLKAAKASLMDQAKKVDIMGGAPDKASLDAFAKQLEKMSISDDTNLTVSVVLGNKDKLTYEQLTKKMSRQRQVQQGARPKAQAAGI